MKQTAVEWLEQQYQKQITFLYREDFEQAKEMEKEQMKDCFLAGDDAIFHGVSKNEIKSFKQYYKEKFNK